MPTIRIEHGDSESAHVQIPLDAPSWVTTWAYAQVRRQGWHTVSPDVYYEETADSALLKIRPGTGPLRQVIRTPITTHRGVLQSLSAA